MYIATRRTRWEAREAGFLVLYKWFLIKIFFSSRQEKDQQQQGYPINNNVIGAKKGHQRRLSDPSSAIHDFMRMGILDKPSNRAIIDRPGGASSLFGSKSDGLDSFGDAHCEIYAGKDI